MLADTANLAAFLTIKNSAQGLPDIDAAVAQNKKICLGAGILKQYQNLFPTAESRMYGFPDDPPFDKVGSDGNWFFEDSNENGTFTISCDVLVEAPKNLLKAQSESHQTPGSCTTEARGPVISGIPLSMPVNEHLDETFSQLLAQMRSENVITRILQANRRESLCQVDSSADTDPLHLPNMASAFFIYLWLFISAVVAIAMKRAMHWVCWTDARRAAQKIASAECDSPLAAASIEDGHRHSVAAFDDTFESLPGAVHGKYAEPEKSGIAAGKQTHDLSNARTLESLLHSVTEGVHSQINTLEAKVDKLQGVLGKLEGSMALMIGKIDRIQSQGIAPSRAHEREEAPMTPPAGIVNGDMKSSSEAAFVENRRQKRREKRQAGVSPQ